MDQVNLNVKLRRCSTAIWRGKKINRQIFIAIVILDSIISSIYPWCKKHKYYSHPGSVTIEPPIEDDGWSMLFRVQALADKRERQKRSPMGSDRMNPRQGVIAGSELGLALV